MGQTLGTIAIFHFIHHYFRMFTPTSTRYPYEQVQVLLTTIDANTWRIMELKSRKSIIIQGRGINWVLLNRNSILIRDNDSDLLAFSISYGLFWN